MFPCQTCGRTFKDPSGLTAHEKIHTGEKKYGCETCAKSFLTNARLKVHQVRANLYIFLKINIGHLISLKSHKTFQSKCHDIQGRLI